jgi:hypothetical protein
MDSLSHQLQIAINEEEPRLRALAEEPAGAGSGWTKKQELGHLIDSATNNRARFIKAALEGELTGPTYDGNGWVEMGGYNEMPWTALVDLWQALNRGLVRVLERIPADRLNAQCRVAGAPPVTLQFLIEDYILHMRHHLDHILSREHMTAYPGAAIGV